MTPKSAALAALDALWAEIDADFDALADGLVDDMIAEADMLGRSIRPDASDVME